MAGAALACAGAAGAVWAGLTARRARSMAPHPGRPSARVRPTSATIPIGYQSRTPSASHCQGGASVGLRTLTSAFGADRP